MSSLNTLNILKKKKTNVGIYYRIMHAS